MFARNLKKIIFQQYYLYILQIIYVLSEENKLLPLTHHTCRMLPHYLVNAKLFHRTKSNVVFLKTLVALERVGRGVALVALKRRTSCDVWQLECQAGNVTAGVKSDHLLHRCVLPVFFATDQLKKFCISQDCAVTLFRYGG